MVRIGMLMVLFFWLSGCGLRYEPNIRSEPLPIDNVEVQIAESFPVQVFASIEGGLPNGCWSLGAISQVREGNTIDLDITMNHSGSEVCTMVFGLVEDVCAWRATSRPVSTCCG
jgi:hypothetical protein